MICSTVPSSPLVAYTSRQRAPEDYESRIEIFDMSPRWPALVGPGGKEIALAKGRGEPRGLRLGSARDVMAALYDDHLDLYAIDGGRLIATVVLAGPNGAVAFLEGGAVDLRGDVPEDQLFCRDGLVLHPWASCAARYLVPGGLDRAFAGSHDFILPGRP